MAAATGPFFEGLELALGAALPGALEDVLADAFAGGLDWLRAGAVACDRAGVATPAITRAARTGSKRNKNVFIPIRPL